MDAPLPGNSTPGYQATRRPATRQLDARACRRPACRLRSVAGGSHGGGHRRAPLGRSVLDGSLTAAPLSDTKSPDAGGLLGRAIRLPAAYVTEHVDLGYALTAHRAQGITVDTSHTLASPRTSREALYVAMTRGRAANHTYLISEPAGEDSCGSTTTPLAPDPTPLMATILANTQAELSATGTLRAAREGLSETELEAALTAPLAARNSAGASDLRLLKDAIAASTSGPNLANTIDEHLPRSTHVRRESALSIADG
jgi:hypothetical protein